MIPMVTELLLLSNKLARLLVRQDFSRLDCSIHEVVSTYTSCTTSPQTILNSLHLEVALTLLSARNYVSHLV